MKNKLALLNAHSCRQRVLGPFERLQNVKQNAFLHESNSSCSEMINFIFHKCQDRNLKELKCNTEFN